MSLDLLTERITELETRVEFQDETIARLNDALVAQQQQFFTLDKTVKLLIEQMRDKNLPAAEPGDQPPPHY